MWKRLSRISSRQYAVGSRHYFPFLLLTAYCLLLTVSCAPKHVEMPSVEMPSYEGISLNDILPALQNIKAIEATISVVYEKQDSSMSGDAILKVSDDSLDFRIYYLGFLAGEIQEYKGIIKSNPRLDRNKSAILVDGLKNSFFWWNIQDYSIHESEDIYILRNSYRKIIISKDTLLPIQQTIELYNGEKLNIFYDLPQRADADSSFLTSSIPLWYQSHLKIELRDQIVMIRVQSYSALR
jgi:hypothetical protein